MAALLTIMVILVLAILISRPLNQIADKHKWEAHVDRENEKNKK